LSERIRWGIVGTGRMAATIAAELARDANSRLVAVASRDAGRARAFAAQHGTSHALTDCEELASRNDVDAIYIATPHTLHGRQMLACIAAGKAVLCEKPFTINAQQAERAISAARTQRVFVMEAMWTRFLPALDVLRALLAQQAIGAIRMIVGGGAFIPQRTANHYLFDPSLGGGVLLDAGVYLVSLASLILGPARSVKACGSVADGIDEQDAILLDHEAGTSLLYVSMRSRRAPDLEILGERGRIRIEAPVFRPAALTVWDGEGRATMTEYPIDGTGYGYQLGEVARSLRAGRLESEMMPLDETLSIMRTLDAVRAQIGLRYAADDSENEQR
jgi:predicted dehydrogenase